MEETDVQNVTDPREQLRGRMMSRYPDRNYDSTDGQTSPNSLDESILEALAEDENNLKGYQELKTETESLAQLFAKSPKAAQFLSALGRTGDPAAAIYEAYGKDAMEAFQSGNASEVIASIEANDAKMRAEQEQFEEEKAANLKKSIEGLDEFGKSKGLSEDEMVDLFLKGYNYLSDALVGIYSTEFFEMILKAQNYDSDIETARREGEVAGRNAKIQARDLTKQAGRVLPPAMQGQGVKPAETPRQRPMTEGDMWLD